jgi:hypothetical protein
VREIPIHGRVTHRRAGGLTMAAEGAASFGTVHTATLDQEAPTTAPAEYAVGDRRDLGYVAARVGYAGRWAGGSAGPSLLFEAHDHAHPFVSAEGWLGLPRLAYAFGELIAGPLSGARLPIAAGIGHADDRIRVEVAIGAANSARQHEDHVAAFSMAVDLMVTERLSLGAFAALNEREGSVGLVRAGWWIAP